MMHKYLLDTNIISDLVRNPQGTIAEHIAAVGERSVCTNIIVASELRYGALKSGSKRLTDQVGYILSAMEVLPLEQPIEHHYALIRHQLTTSGTPIGPNDLIIAAHALERKLTLVTANIREFSRVPSLPIENWLNR